MHCDREVKVACLGYSHVATAVFVMVSQVMQMLSRYTTALRVPLYTASLLQVEKRERLGASAQEASGTRVSHKVHIYRRCFGYAQRGIDVPAEQRE